MSFLDLLQNVLRTKNTQMAWGAIPDGHVIGERRAENFTPNDDYLIVRLSSMFLGESRRLWLKLSPLSHSTVELNGQRERQTHSAVIGPAQFDDLATAAADRNVILGQRLCGPVVWRGGDLDIAAGLFAVPKDQAAVALLSTLGDLSALGIPGLDQAKEIATIVKKGVEGLIGLDGTKPVLAANVSLKQADAKPMVLVGIAAPQTEIDFSTLWIKGGRLCTGASAAALRPFESHDHLIIAIERGPMRQDWRGLPSLSEPEKAFHEVFADAGLEVDDAKKKLNEAFRVFDAALQAEEGLTEPDKKRIRGEVIATLKDWIAQIDNPLGFGVQARRAAVQKDGSTVDLTDFDFLAVEPRHLEAARPAEAGTLPF